MTMSARIHVSTERLVTREGTIIPQAVRFADGGLTLCYHTGNDAWFSPSGMHRSGDDGATWQRMDLPLRRVTAMGCVGAERGLFFDQYLWRTAADEYAAFYSETRDSGRTLCAPLLARFSLPGAVDRRYAPRATGRPDAYAEPEIPPFYDAITQKHGAEIGGHIFGPVIRLPDGALGLSAYAQMQGNPSRAAAHGATPGDGVAEEGGDILFSSLFFRSEDDGATWRHAGTIGRPQRGFPFDAGQRYSEGFTETAVAPTADGGLVALMRHGSYLLLWRAMSQDGGRTWSHPICMNHAGVAPSLAPMPGGVLAAAWGRPGMTVAFSLDGTGRSWDVLAGIMQDDTPSQKYPWLVAVDARRALLFYDKRRWDASAERFVEHGIWSREVRIEPSGAR